jgi:hypothetical protein
LDWHYRKRRGHQAVVQLDYVTLEYAGSSHANIELQNGLLIAHHSLVRYSATDGVRFDSSTGGSLLDGQIYGNASYNPGQQITVTVTKNAGSPVAQGSQPMVAVEGYGGSQLIGGVTLNILVPDYRPFNGLLSVFLPNVQK